MHKRTSILSFILPAALTLLVTSACVSIDIQSAPEEEMTFKAFQTKAAPSPVISSMGIFAIKTPDPAGSDAVTSWEKTEFWTKKDASTLYINDGLFAPFNGSYAGADKTDITKHVPYLWPDSGSLMFSAYAPHQSQSQQQIKSVQIFNHAKVEYLSRMEIKVVLDPTNVEVAEGKTPLDLLWADPQNINSAKTAGKSSEALPLLFKHALAKVTFRISNPQQQYELSAKLLNCVNSGTFYSGKARGWLPDFNDQANLLRDYDLFNAKPTPLSETPAESSLLLIPMELSGQYPQVGPNTDKVVTLEMQLVSKDGVGRETVSFPMTDYTKTWEYGKHYTYNITINNGLIEFGEPVINSLNETTDL